MALTFGFFLDAGLTAPATALAVAQATDGSTPAADRVFYIGSTTANKKIQAESAPGVDQITLSLADTGVGTGVEATHVKLAATAAGLATAVAGAALDLGTQILSGVANAQPVHVRIDTPALTSGVYADLSFALASVVEVAAS